MGSFYTKITVKTTGTDRVEAALRLARRVGLIAPPDRGCTVVFDAPARPDSRVPLARGAIVGARVPQVNGNVRRRSAAPRIKSVGADPRRMACLR